MPEDLARLEANTKLPRQSAKWRRTFRFRIDRAKPSIFGAKFATLLLLATRCNRPKQETPCLDDAAVDITPLVTKGERADSARSKESPNLPGSHQPLHSLYPPPTESRSRNVYSNAGREFGELRCYTAIDDKSLWASAPRFDANNFKSGICLSHNHIVNHICWERPADLFRGPQVTILRGCDCKPI